MPVISHGPGTAPPAAPVGRRCFATFQPQAWINDYAVDIDGRYEFDITEQILALGEEKARRIEDHDDDSDALWGAWSADGTRTELPHDGPFSVTCEDAIAAFFDAGSGGPGPVSRGTKGTRRAPVSPESYGFCDTCDRPYLATDELDHCAECGTCREHCACRPVVVPRPAELAPGPAPRRPAAEADLDDVPTRRYPATAAATLADLVADAGLAATLRSIGITDWGNGGCWLLAEAIRQAWPGWETVGIVEEGDEAVDHVVAASDGWYADAYGIRDGADFVADAAEIGGFDAPRLVRFDGPADASRHHIPTGDPTLLATLVERLRRGALAA